MKRLSGLKLLEEREGAGTPANKGDCVGYNTRMFLNQGEKCPLIQSRQSTFQKEMFRVEEGTTFIDHTIVLGRHQLITDVEHVLTGMIVGGYRKVRVSTQLAYRDKGIPDLAPPDAVLICQIWLRNSTGSSSVESLPGVT